VAPRNFSYPDHPYCGEIAAPIVSLFSVDNDEEAFLLLRILQMNSCRRATGYIYSSQPHRIKRFGELSSISRILVNVPGIQFESAGNSGTTPEVYATASVSGMNLRDFCRPIEIVYSGAGEVLSQNSKTLTELIRDTV
jgi:hypothetical protein